MPARRDKLRDQLGVADEFIGLLTREMELRLRSAPTGSDGCSRHGAEG